MLLGTMSLISFQLSNLVGITFRVNVPSGFAPTLSLSCNFLVVALCFFDVFEEREEVVVVVEELCVASVSFS